MSSSNKRSRAQYEQGREHRHASPPRKLMRYTLEELNRRSDKFGSQLSIVDRRKFAREFNYKTQLSLTKEEEQIYVQNPHIQQVFANRQPFVRVVVCAYTY